MTDKNLASLAPLDLIHMLHVAQAHYFTAKNDHEREIIQKQKDEVLAAMQTIADGGTFAPQKEVYPNAFGLNIEKDKKVLLT